MGTKFSKKQLICFFILSITFSLYSNVLGQNNGTVTGRIIDTNKKPVEFVKISIEKTDIGSYTNENGEYHLLNVPGGNRTIIISGVGITTQNKMVQIVSGKETIVPDIEINNSIELNEVAIIAKTEARKQQEQAYAITVLDFKKSYNTTAPLNKLLNNISSVRIREDGGVGSDYNFSLNGFSGNQVKFFMDGIPMDNFGSSFNLSNISVNMAERVEVYKGVLPVSLGGDALGGAVNIISRKDMNYLDASYSIGSFNTHRASVNGAYTDLKSGFTIRTNAFFNYSDNNYRVFVPVVDLNTNQKSGEQWVNRFHDKYQSAGLKLETGIVNKSFADYLLAGVILSENDKDVQTGATMDAVYGGVKSKSNSFIPSIRYKKSDLFTEGLSLSLYGAYSKVNSFNIDTLARNYNWFGEWVASPDKGESYYTNAEINNSEWISNSNLTYSINEHHLISANNLFSSVERKIFDEADPQNESNKIPQNLKKNITGLGWQANYKRWTATVFGKLYHLQSSTYKIMEQYTVNEHLEKINDEKTNYGYGAAVTAFILPKLQGKLSYEHAYRLPESTEMFGDGLIQQRNPDLKPESSDNFNLGLTYEHSFKLHTFFVDANFIYRDTKDFIRKGVSLTANPTTGYENLGNVLTQGIEGGLRYQWKDLLILGANMTYQNIIDNQQFEENKNSYVGEGISENITYKQRLPNIPYLFGHADLGLKFKNIALKNSELTVDYAINYVHDYYLSFPGLGAKSTKKFIPEQISQDIALGYSLQNGRYNIVLECTNLTDAKLYDNYRLQKPGRAFNLKLRYFLK